MTFKSFQNLVQERRMESDHPKDVETRIDGETTARAIISDHLGVLTANQVDQFCRAANRCYHNNRTLYNRFLPARMEEAMAARGIRTAFTIARAVEFGMNITSARLGYEFSGRLINNTQIAGDLESMNVWHRRLRVN